MKRSVKVFLFWQGRSLLDVPLWIVDGSLCDPWTIVPREVIVCETTSSARDDLRVWAVGAEEIVICTVPCRLFSFGGLCLTTDVASAAEEVAPSPPLGVCTDKFPRAPPEARLPMARAAHPRKG